MDRLAQLRFAVIGQQGELAPHAGGVLMRTSGQWPRPSSCRRSRRLRWISRYMAQRQSTRNASVDRVAHAGTERAPFGDCSGRPLWPRQHHAVRRAAQMRPVLCVVHVRCVARARKAARPRPPLFFSHAVGASPLTEPGLDVLGAVHRFLSGTGTNVGGRTAAHTPAAERPRSSACVSLRAWPT